MAQPYIGEIRMFAGSFAPAGWAFCHGQLLPISENDALFNLIGTTYGGDGQETFAVPNMQGRVPLHMGTGPDGTTYHIGELAGTEMETLTTQQIPSHTHLLAASADPASPAFTATNGVPGKTAGANLYALQSGTPGTMMNQPIMAAGGSQPHENMAPFLCISYIISLFGIYPSPT